MGYDDRNMGKFSSSSCSSRQPAATPARSRVSGYTYSAMETPEALDLLNSSLISGKIEIEAKLELTGEGLDDWWDSNKAVSAIDRLPACAYPKCVIRKPPTVRTACHDFFYADGVYQYSKAKNIKVKGPTENKGRGVVERREHIYKYTPALLQAIRSLYRTNQVISLKRERVHATVDLEYQDAAFAVFITFDRCTLPNRKAPTLYQFEVEWGMSLTPDTNITCYSLINRSVSFFQHELGLRGVLNPITKYEWAWKHGGLA